MLCVRDLDKRLRGFALRQVCFAVEGGGYFVLLGASGVGKTVLLETVAGVTHADQGQVLLDGVDITHERAQKRRLGLVYQDQGLFPHMTVRRNIGYGLRAKGTGRTARRKRVEEMAAQTGVVDLLDRYPASLSGGEAQRVALARTLATEPRCLLLDEPISSLDTQARIGMRGLLRRLNREGHTVIHVTHDYEEAISLATRVGIMENGSIAQIGTPKEIFHHPKSEFVAQFVGIRNFFPGHLEAPESGPGGLARFVTGPLAFKVLCGGRPGPGRLVLRSEDITVSRTRPESSAQNSFLGCIVDIAPARLGVEVMVDIGVEVAALLTPDSVGHLGLHHGQKVWVSFKATAARFFEG